MPGERRRKKKVILGVFDNAGGAIYVSQFINASFTEDILKKLAWGDNLRIRIVPNEGNTVDPAGIEYREDDTQYTLNTDQSVAGGLMGSNGYQVTATATHVQLNNVEFSQGGGWEPHFDGKTYLDFSSSRMSNHLFNA